MRKFFFHIIIVCALLLGGCAASPSFPGAGSVIRARELHTELEGADIVMTDNISGEVIQKISYLFVGEVMTYMYEGHEDGKSYYEYNNGTEMNWLTIPDETKWSFAAKGSADYYTYSRASRHYFADGERLIPFYDKAVSGDSRPDGDPLKLQYSYDEEMLKEYSAFADMGELSDFTISYVFSEDGHCTEFTNEYTLDGTKYSYTVTVSERKEPVKRTEVTEIVGVAQKSE